MKAENITDELNIEVIEMIDNILFNIKDLSSKRDFYEAYYFNMEDLLGLDELLKIKNNINTKKSYLPLPKVNVPITNLTTKIINKDDFSLPSPSINNTERLEKNHIDKYKLSHSKSQIINDNFKIHDTEEEFDHDI